ncbi:MAG: 7-carboxy-7-deazaguanine synthase QueE [Actinobacteria bacterium]|nr:7-carboxy-7-deazaguanine synthase QueE [Actinomycetota bacterium]
MRVSEIFYSIQGEGHNTGIAMVFVRLAGCNLHCSFCDTQYALGPSIGMDEYEIIEQVRRYGAQWVCITGGEPFLQDISLLTSLLRQAGVRIHIETNGTLFYPVACDWLVVSPKQDTEPDLRTLENAHEIKCIINSADDLAGVRRFEEWGMYHSVQPVDNRTDIVKVCVDFIKTNPKWRLSMQLHKLIGID